MEIVMSLKEMETNFPNEWLLISNPVLDSQKQMTGGIVAFHSKDRDEVYRKASELKLGMFGFWSTGRIPPGTAILL